MYKIFSANLKIAWRRSLFSHLNSFVGSRPCKGREPLELKLEISLQIDHVDQLCSLLINWMIVIFQKKVFQSVVSDKPAFFIEGNCRETVSCSNLKDRVLTGIGLNQKINQLPSIPLPLELRNDCQVFQLQNPISLIGDDTLRFDPTIFQNIHRPTLQIAVNHILLFVSQQEKR